MNGYICFWKSKQVEVHADTSYQAQLKAAELLRCKKPHEITICLAERGGECVTHKPQDFLP